MVSAFSTALGTALTTFVSDVTTAVGDNAGLILPVSLGIAGLFLVHKVIKRLVSR